MLLSFDSLGAIQELGILNGDGYVSIGNSRAKCYRRSNPSRSRSNNEVRKQNKPKQTIPAIIEILKATYGFGDVTEDVFRISTK